MTTTANPDILQAFSQYGIEDKERNCTPFLVGTAGLLSVILFVLCLIVMVGTSVALPAGVVLIVPIVSTLASAGITYQFIKLDHPAVYNRSIIIESGENISIFRSNEPTADETHHYLIYLHPFDDFTLRYGGIGTPTEGVHIKTLRRTNDAAIDTETDEYTKIGKTRLLE
jgi:hypothetical protein